MPLPAPNHQPSLDTGIVKSLETNVSQINAFIEQYNQVANDSIRKKGQLNDLNSQIHEAQAKLTALNGQISSFEDDLLVKKRALLLEVEQKTAFSQKQLENEREALQEQKQNHQTLITELKLREDSLNNRENALIAREKVLKASEITIHEQQDELKADQKAINDKETDLSIRTAAIMPKEQAIAEKLHKITEDVAGIAKDRDEINKLLKQGQDLLAEAHLKMSAAKAQEVKLAHLRKILEGKQLDVLKLSKALKLKEVQLNDRSNILDTHATDFNI